MNKRGRRDRGWTGLLSMLGCALGVLVLAGCSSGQQVVSPLSLTHTSQSSNVGALSSSDPVSPASDEIIRPGDQVQVMVWGYPEFNTTTTVKDYGTISLPLVGDVIAAGLSEKQLAEGVKQRLTQYVKGDARVTISHIDLDKRISVMGAVTKQGNYPALREESLVEILAAAGGTAPNADLSHVRIFKQGRATDVVGVDLQDYLQSGSAANVPTVKPGDTIFVPTQENFVREISSYAQDLLVLFGFFTLLH